MSTTSRRPHPAHDRMWIVAPSCFPGHRGGARALPARRRAVLLRAALGLVTALGASAATARSRPRAEPAEAARACPEMGEGFVRLPGSDTCVKLGGSVRVEVMKQGGSDR